MAKKKQPVFTPMKYHPVQAALFRSTCRFDVVPAGRRSGKCIAQGTKIYMQDGTQRNVEDIDAGDYVLSVNEHDLRIQPKRVSHVYENGMKNTITIKTGRRELTVTANHPIFNGNCFIEAGDLNVGDLVAIPNYIGMFESAVDQNIDITDDEIEMLAIWLTEGHHYCLANGNPQIMARIFHISKKWNLTPYWDGRVSFYLANDRRGKSNTGTQHELRFMLERYGLWGTNSKTKFIPDDIFKLNKRQLALFLNRMFACDGCLMRKKTKYGNSYSLGIAFANEIMLKQVAMLMHKFGILLNTRHKIHRKKGKDGKNFESWHAVTTRSEHIYKYCKEIGMIGYDDVCYDAVRATYESSGTNNLYLPIEYDDFVRHLSYKPVERQGSNVDRAFISDAPSELLQVLRKWRKYNTSRISVKAFDKIQKYTDGYYDVFRTANIEFEEIKHIEFGGARMTYDLTVEDNHNFLSEGFITHNTEIVGKRRLIKRAYLGSKYTNPRYAVCAPTYSQAKKIYWGDLKRYCNKKYVYSVSEANNIITLVTGTEIHVIGMDKPERIEGSPWDGIVLDEYGNMKKKTWTEHVRPALSDRNGWCSFIGVPEGRNHYYDLYKAALADTTGRWGVFHWPSSDILDPDEIEQAKKDMDELTFAQEYEGSFINFTGRAYYPFDDKYHCDRLFSDYNPNWDLVFCFDFNVSPGIAAIIQEFPLLDDDDVPVDETLTAVIGEVYITRNSNTEMICNKLIKDWGNHKGRILCYGDMTGGASGTAKLQGSDWDIIERMLKRHFSEDQVEIRLQRHNPLERDRVNAMNSRLKSMDNEIHLMVDPHKAPMTVKDFEGVCVVEGGSGELDKKSSPDLTHLCFVAETIVETDKGFIPIRELPEQGKIRSIDNRFVDFTDAGKRGDKECVKILLSDGNEIICTDNHRFLTNEGWLEAVDIQDTILYSNRYNEILYNKGGYEWTFKLSEFLKMADRLLEERSFNSIPITTEELIIFTDTFTELFTSITVEKFLKVIAYTTLMEIFTTIKSQILNVCHHRLICHYIWSQPNEKKKLLRLYSNMLHLKLPNGMDQKKEERGIVNMQKVDSVRRSGNIHARFVGQNTKIHEKQKQDFVQENAKPRRVELIRKIMVRKELASIAAKFFLSTNIDKESNNTVTSNVIIKAKKVSRVGIHPVFCPDVETGCFALPNSVIVSNTDAIGYYCHYEYPIRMDYDPIQTFEGF